MSNENESSLQILPTNQSQHDADLSFAKNDSEINPKLQMIGSGSRV